MKTEQLKEGWVSFKRYHCTDGYIDYWIGDCNNNPNNSEKSKSNLNISIVEYFRLNNGKWYKNFTINKNLFILRTFRFDFTANEIFYNYFQIE